MFQIPCRYEPIKWFHLKVNPGLDRFSLESRVDHDKNTAMYFYATAIEKNGLWEVYLNQAKKYRRRLIWMKWGDLDTKEKTILGFQLKDSLNSWMAGNRKLFFEKLIADRFGVIESLSLCIDNLKEKFTQNISEIESAIREEASEISKLKIAIEKLGETPK